MKAGPLVLLFVAFVSLAVTTYYLVSKKQDKTSLLLADRDFAVKDIHSISKIFLASRSKNPILLEKINGVWMVNNKYKAAENPLKNLLHTLRDIRMQSIPSKGHVKSIMEGIAVYGIKVELYDSDGKKIKTFYIGGTTQQEYGTYFFMEHGTQPYIMEIPHFAGNLRERFDLDEMDWRDKTVFDFTFTRVESIQLDYPLQSDSGFRIVKEENEYGIYSPSNNNSKKKLMANQEFKNYLNHFENIGAEAIQNDHPIKKEIAKLQPYCIISVQLTGQSSATTYRFYPIAGDTTGAVNYIFDPELVAMGKYFRLHVDRSDGDFLLVQYPNVMGIFRKRQDFNLN